MSLAGRLIGALHASQTPLEDFFKLQLRADYFKGEAEAELYAFVTQHVTKHGVIPAKETIEAATHSLIPIEVAEPPTFYRDQMRDRYVHQGVKQAIIDAQKLLNESKPDEAYELIKADLLKIQLTSSAGKIVNYATEAKAMLKAELAKPKGGILSGWAYLDNMVGGLQGGDVQTIVGRPGAGKTYLMLHSGKYAWLEQKKVPMLVSMEMKPLPLVQRLAAMDAKVAVTPLKKGDYHGKGIYQEKLWATLDANKDRPPFRIIDGALAASMDDIVLYTHQFKPDVVYIDGAYLIKAASKYGSNWEKQGETLSRVKADLAEALDIPVVISFQFNRDATKVKKGEAPGLENIAYSDAVGQLSSVVLGMMQPDTAESKDVETINKRQVTIMKGRSGETGSFWINWIFDDYPFMDFSEYHEPIAAELQY